MDSYFIFLLVVMATWRATHMLTNEDGPFDVFAKLRSIVGVRYDTFSVPYPTNGIAGAFLCVECMSVWISFVGALFSPFYTADVRSYIVNALALSAFVIVLDNLISRMEIQED